MFASRRGNDAKVFKSCTAHHPGTGGVADIVSVTMPLLSIKDLVAAKRGLLRMTHSYIIVETCPGSL